MSNRIPFCVAPWVASHAEAAGGRSLCCVAKKSYQYEDLEDWWNSPELRAIRLQMLDGVPPQPDCISCTEALFRTPQKLIYAREFPAIAEQADNLTAADGSTVLRPLEYEIKQHLCNLRCRSCGPNASSSILSEYKKKQPGKVFDIHPLQPEPESTDLVWMAEHATRLFWTGGEPFMSPYIIPVLERIIELGRADLVDVGVITNMMFSNQKRCETILELLSHFKKIRVSASLDGMGQVGEFCREGWNEADFKANFTITRKLIPHVNMGVSYTLSSASVFGLAETAKFCDDYKVKSPWFQLINTDILRYMHYDHIKKDSIIAEFERAKATVPTNALIINQLNNLEGILLPKLVGTPITEYGWNLLKEDCEHRGHVGFFEQLTKGHLVE